VAGYTYLVTTKAAPKRNLTNPLQIAEGICDTLLWLRAGGRMALHAFVVMPDHIHVIITPGHDHTLPNFMHSLKGFTVHRWNPRLNLKGPMWQPGYHEESIRSRQTMEDAIGYVEHNPVEAGLVDKAEEWPYSSANEHYRELMDTW